jgi:hypothetical protein
MNGVCTFIKKNLSKTWPDSRAALFLILSLFLVSCAPSHKFLGTKQPGFKNNSCPIESEFCTLSVSKNDWKIIGTYYLDKMADGNYNFRGSIKVDVEEASPVFQSVSRISLTFIFFQNETVIHEEIVDLKGEANEYIKFSQIIESGKELESSAFAWYNFRVSELPAMGMSKKSTAPKELLPRKTYIRIESDEQIFENGQLKFTAKPGDIFEVIRVKTCISGSGTCWQVRNLKTGETGFRRADVMKQRHTVFEDTEQTISDKKLDTEPLSDGNLAGSDITGTYRSDITTNTGYMFRHPKHRKLIISLKQEGKTITGTDNIGDSEITGTLEGDTIKYNFWSKKINLAIEVSGEWKVYDDGRTLQGFWRFATSKGYGGKWNLTRIE